MNRAQPDRRPLSRARVVSCVLVNLCATPGLGSLAARRVVAGTGQLLLALAGFALIVGWMFEFFRRVMLEQLGEPFPSDGHGWMGKWGLFFFVASWFWALFTSVSLLRAAKPDEPAEPGPVPPRSVDSSAQPPKLS